MPADLDQLARNGDVERTGLDAQEAFPADRIPEYS